MILYNTLSRAEDEIKPINNGKIGMYVCGPTVYDFDHIGQARTWIFFDWIKRYLQKQGFDVTLVQNITDVGHLVGDEEEGEDKIENKSKKENKTPEEIARFFENEHIKDLESLNIIRPDFMPRATDYITDIIEYIKVLIEKGYAYEVNGNVYFQVEKLPSYGELSHRNLDELVSGTRVKENSEKRNPADFALWKKAEENHLQKWESPWGEGFPGWHIECSVMSAKILGQPFDIHGSAIEHIFPHHENEIAQSKAYAGKPLANVFLHGGMLNINGVKMGKSLGNFITVKDILQKHDADVVKLAFMQTFWRKPFNWEENAILSAQKLKDKLVRAKNKKNDNAKDHILEFENILNNDFNTPKLLTLINEKIDEFVKNDITYLQDVFGLVLSEKKKELTQKQKDMVENREKYRKNKDFVKADEIRKELEKEGIILEDTENGVKLLDKR